MELAESRCITTTAFGNRDVQAFVEHIREYTDLPIVVYSDREREVGKDVWVVRVEGKWPNHRRYGQRNGDLYQAVSALQSGYTTVLYLDDDMRIVNPNFMQGFRLAEKFGLCLPLNPRCFVGVDAAIGEDVYPNDKNVSVPLATAYNSCPMFSCLKYKWVESFLGIWIHNMSGKRPMVRGPLAIWHTVEETGRFPYVLPYEWCVCTEHCKKTLRDPIILHCGHKDVAEWYKEIR